MGVAEVLLRIVELQSIRSRSVGALSCPASPPPCVCDAYAIQVSDVCVMHMSFVMYLCIYMYIYI